MSKSEVATITCPNCGHQQPFTVWLSVNVTLDPGLKERILDRSLTTFTCEDCGSAASIEQDLLYHDMERQLMVLRLPEGEVPDEVGGESFRLLSTLSENAYNYRLVSSMNELAEKILIWEDRLDDRTVEVFKLVVWQALDEERRTDDAQLFYGGISGVDSNDAEMEFVLVSESGSVSMFVPLEDEFRRLERQIIQGLPDPASERGKWLRVDRAYAEAILDQLDEGSVP